MWNFSESENSKCASIKEIEIDTATVDFTGLDEYDPRIMTEGGGITL